MTEKIKMLNTWIDSLSMEDLLKKIGEEGGVIFTPNVDHLMKLRLDQDFLDVYNAASFRVCDSQIIMFASKFIGQPIKEKISGSDLFPAFCDHYKHDEQTRVFLLGGPEGVADLAREKINAKVGRSIVVASYSPPLGFEQDWTECQKIVDLINVSGATVLAVGLGAPKQEQWIHNHKEQLKNIKTFFAIGATIEFEAGFRPRSPKWVSQVGLEWFYRLITEPKRLWKRYLVEGFPFFYLVLKQKLEINRLSDKPSSFYVVRKLVKAPQGLKIATFSITASQLLKLIALTTNRRP